jgi:hypothetical protein
METNPVSASYPSLPVPHSVPLRWPNAGLTRFFFRPAVLCADGDRLIGAYNVLEQESLSASLETLQEIRVSICVLRNHFQNFSEVGDGSLPVALSVSLEVGTSQALVGVCREGIVFNVEFENRDRLINTFLKAVGLPSRAPPIAPPGSPARI